MTEHAKFIKLQDHGSFPFTSKGTIERSEAEIENLYRDLGVYEGVSIKFTEVLYEMFTRKILYMRLQWYRRLFRMKPKRYVLWY